MKIIWTQYALNDLQYIRSYLKHPGMVYGGGDGADADSGAVAAVAGMLAFNILFPLSAFTGRER